MLFLDWVFTFCLGVFFYETQNDISKALSKPCKYLIFFWGKSRLDSNIESKSLNNTYSNRAFVVTSTQNHRLNIIESQNLIITST